MTDAAASPVPAFDDYDSAPCGLLLTQADGTLIRVNQTFASMAGSTPGELLTRRFSELLDAGSRLFFETRCLPVLRLSGEAREISLALARPHESALPVLVNFVTHGDIISVAVFDATQRRDYERQLLETQRAAETAAHRVQVLQNASMAFGAAETESDLAMALVDTMRAAFSAPHASVELLDAFGELHDAAGTFPLGRSTEPRLGSVPSLAIHRREVVIVPTIADAEGEVAAAMIAGAIEFFACAPLIDDGEVLGVVSVYFSRQRETDDRASDLMAALSRQASQTLSRIRLRDQLTKFALYDALTALANRKLLHERLQQVLAASARHTSAMAVIFVDLDGFKAVNDTLGHPVGDLVLQEVAGRLREVVRADDTIGRFGGDEFVVICGDAGVTEATVVAQRILLALAESFPHAGGLPITASIGIATGIATAASTGEQVLGLADVAMYESKRTGRNRLNTVEF